MITDKELEEFCAKLRAHTYKKGRGERMAMTDRELEEYITEQMDREEKLIAEFRETGEGDALSMAAGRYSMASEIRDKLREGRRQ